MLLQTNSYIVSEEKRAEHARLMRHFRQTLARLGCDQFEVFEHIAPNFAPHKAAARFVQMMRFRDRQHHRAVQEAERRDPAAQQLIRDFCALVGLEHEKERSLFATGFYRSLFSSSATAEPAEETQESLPSPAAEDSLISRDFTTADLPTTDPET